MFGKTNDSSAFALVCYCVLAMGITLPMTQSSGNSQDKSDSGKKEIAEKSKESDVQSNGSSEEKKEQDKTATKDSEKAAKATGASDQSTPKSAENKSPGKSNLPVVRINTEATDKKDSLLIFQSDTFDVDPPEWFSEPSSSSTDDEYVVPFYVIGFDDNQVESEMESRLMSEINKYVDQVLDTNAHQYVVFTEEEKKGVVVREETRAGLYFDGSKQKPVDFHFAHLKFDKNFRANAKSKWIERQQQSRLIQFGLIGGATFLLIVFVFGGLRLNTATSGYYQGRLQFFVAIVILGVIGAGIYFSTWIDWL